MKKNSKGRFLNRNKYLEISRDLRVAPIPFTSRIDSKNFKISGLLKVFISFSLLK